MSWYYDWKPYVPVAERRRRAMKKMDALRKKGVDIQPISIDGRKIARTFWGEAWCDHLESFSDYENRLPRGRTYVRNGSVCHLAITEGQVEAKVSGSELYNVRVQIKKLPPKKWKGIKQRCAGQIGSLLELLQGRLSSHVMGVVTDRQEGLFPLPGEISFGCDCPDWAVMCKHVAAVLYGVGARLDHKPELLFTLRGVDHEELTAADTEAAVSAATSSGKSRRLAVTELSDVFGIDLDDGLERPSQPPSRKPPRKSTPKPAKRGRVEEAVAAKKAPRRVPSTVGRKSKNNAARKKPGRPRASAGEAG